MSTAQTLRSDDASERLAAVAEMKERTSVVADEIEALIECLDDEQKAIQRRAAEALAALIKRGLANRQILLGQLESGLARQRWGAAFAFSLLGPPPAPVLPVLLEFLGSEDGDLRWAAAVLLVQMEERSAVIASLCALVRDGNATQRKMALYCLRDCGMRTAAVDGFVFVALRDADVGVRLGAVSTIARLAADPAGASHRLIDALDDSDERVGRAAAIALGALGERSGAVFAALDKAATSADPSLQRAARRALRQLRS